MVAEQHVQWGVQLHATPRVASQHVCPGVGHCWHGPGQVWTCAALPLTCTYPQQCQLQPPTHLQLLPRLPQRLDLRRQPPLALLDGCIDVLHCAADLLQHGALGLVSGGLDLRHLLHVSSNAGKALRGRT